MFVYMVSAFVMFVKFKSVTFVKFIPDLFFSILLSRIILGVLESFCLTGSAVIAETFQDPPPPRYS